MSNFTIMSPFLFPAFFEKLSWKKSLLAGLIIFLSCFGVETVTAFISGLALPVKDGPANPYFGDYIVWPVFSAIIMPLFVIFLVRFYQYSNVLINDLIEKDILIVKSEKFSDFLKDIQSRKWQILKIFIILITSIITGYLFYKKFLGYESKCLDEWAYQDGLTVLGYVKCVTFCMQLFIVLYGIWDAIWFSMKLERILNNTEEEKNGYEIKLAYLHPDNCSGLCFIGKSALYIYLMVTALGLYISTQYIEKFIVFPNEGIIKIIVMFPWMQRSVIFYLIFLPILLYLPLSCAHKKMKDTRENMLRMIGFEFNQLHEEMKNILESKHDDVTNVMIDRLEAIQKHYNIVNSFPVWPFDIKFLSYVLSTFMFSVILPLIIGYF